MRRLFCVIKGIFCQYYHHGGDGMQVTRYLNGKIMDLPMDENLVVKNEIISSTIKQVNKRIRETASQDKKSAEYHDYE